ncbi:MAG: hypothetical protein FWC15_05115 [Fibromonadales bacterium]|nr:hypothetical protein [Fibromonadales bacterium]
MESVPSGVLEELLGIAGGVPPPVEPLEALPSEPEEPPELSLKKSILS